MRNNCRMCGRRLVAEQSRKREVGTRCYRKFLKGYAGVPIEQFESIEGLRRKLDVK